MVQHCWRRPRLQQRLQALRTLPLSGKVHGGTAVARSVRELGPRRCLYEQLQSLHTVTPAGVHDCGAPIPVLHSCGCACRHSCYVDQAYKAQRTVSSCTRSGPVPSTPCAPAACTALIGLRGMITYDAYQSSDAAHLLSAARLQCCSGPRAPPHAARSGRARSTATAPAPAGRCAARAPGSAARCRARRLPRRRAGQTCRCLGTLPARCGQAATPRPDRHASTGMNNVTHSGAARGSVCPALGHSCCAGRTSSPFETMQHGTAGTTEDVQLLTGLVKCCRVHMRATRAQSTRDVYRLLSKRRTGLRNAACSSVDRTHVHMTQLKLVSTSCCEDQRCIALMGSACLRDSLR